jgi:hypothetical protein
MVRAKTSVIAMGFSTSTLDAAAGKYSVGTSARLLGKAQRTLTSALTLNGQVLVKHAMPLGKMKLLILIALSAMEKATHKTTLTNSSF